VLKIIADENIPFAVAAFGALGEVRLLPGRTLAQEDLRDADILLVRSITNVNADLLRGTPVRFVGTATIGVDHIDGEYLKTNGIAFASAIGSNANSVAEYVTAALLHLAAVRGLALAGKILGVLGAGHVGSRVIQKARALGMQVLVCDPPLARNFQAAQTSPPFEFFSLAEIMHADFITLHTPLTAAGTDRTHHLFDEKCLRALQRGSVLINTARGAVVDNLALKKVLQAGALAAAVLDVWENEPHPDSGLLSLTTIATPHIAGYSFDGKVQGTQQIYAALCRFLKVHPSWNAAAALPAPAQPAIQINETFNSEAEVLHKIVRQAYDIGADDRALSSGFEPNASTKAQPECHFDQLRRTYPVRREFGNYSVILKKAKSGLAKKLRGLGFQTASAP